MGQIHRRNSRHVVRLGLLRHSRLPLFPHDIPNIPTSPASPTMALRAAQVLPSAKAELRLIGCLYFEK